jgi:NADH:ubiquinone oxidoreductase subunit 6 (subunit J)
MRKMTWIWFAGFAAWLADAVINLRLQNAMHARLALMVALVFLAAAFFYRNQPR